MREAEGWSFHLRGTPQGLLPSILSGICTVLCGPYHGQNPPNPEGVLKKIHVGVSRKTLHSRHEPGGMKRNKKGKNRLSGLSVRASPTAPFSFTCFFLTKSHLFVPRVVGLAFRTPKPLAIQVQALVLNRTNRRTEVVVKNKEG